MRLFRQQIRGDWQAAVESAARELRNLSEGNA
jgi:hypothetical protein